MGRPPKESPTIVFFKFFWFSRVFFCFLHGASPQRIPKFCFFCVCFFLFFGFLEMFLFFLIFSMGPLPKESPFEPDNEGEADDANKDMKYTFGGVLVVCVTMYIYIYILI